ncbi:MAG: hypothetical protein M1816_002297 [Peltula sp. TS41687]|nr:MAG: hypothetical protein M1816_002297 [Peltula sp. TS41687]
MSTQNYSPPASPTSTISSKSRNRPGSLDLSCIPPLIQPAPPTNTLLITNLFNPEIFRPDHLQTIRELINDSAPIHTWSPLKSFRRIVVSFYSAEHAIHIRSLLDGEAIMDERIRVYFGENTPIEPVDQHLQAPESQKLFFISPPPSPPMGWEMRNEEPPNKQVHADDLATALSKLHARAQGSSPFPTFGDEMDGVAPSFRERAGSSTMIYHPADHGDSPDLPAIAVEDLTWEPEEMSPIDGWAAGGSPTTTGGQILHTARPPVELMEQD